MKSQRYWTCILWFCWGVLCVTVLTLSCRHECLIITGAIATHPEGVAGLFVLLTMACVFMTIVLASQLVGRYLTDDNDHDGGP